MAGIDLHLCCGRQSCSTVGQGWSESDGAGVCIRTCMPPLFSQTNTSHMLPCHARLPSSCGSCVGNITCHLSFIQQLVHVASLHACLFTLNRAPMSQGHICRNTCTHQPWLCSAGPVMSADLGQMLDEFFEYATELQRSLQASGAARARSCYEGCAGMRAQWTVCSFV